MGQRSVRVVVGQGDLDHEGSLRAVLERDGVDVVGEATNASQLARVLTDEQPDIVVLDDVIGVSAVELTTQIVPEARIVVVWPAAVMPIAGAVRVEPAEVATTLAATVALAAGLRGLGGIDRPEWIDRVKKDPATLREMLAARGAVPVRPSVTELQRRGHRLHPSPSAAKRAARATDAAAASVVPIGLAASQRGDPPADADGAAAGTVAPAVLSSAWNRRLGIISLGGAAAAGALMIALALGPHGSSVNSAEPFVPSSTQQGGGPAITPGGGTQTPGGNGGPTTTGGGNTNGSANGSGGPGTGPGSTGGTSPHGSLGSLDGNGGSGSGTGGTGSPAGPRSSSSHLPGAHGTGKPGAPGWQGSAPGGSGDHNPHGGPPGHDQGSSHGSGQGNGGGNGQGKGQGNGNAGGQGHAGGSHGASSGSHGNGHANGHSAGSHGNGHANGHSAGHGNSTAAHRHKR
jgi:hypothetical protein